MSTRKMLSSAWLAEKLAGMGVSGPIYIAYSGGVDSTVLLHLASGLGPSMQVVALHADHGLCEDASNWVVHCRDVAEERGVEFISARVDVRLDAGLGYEGAAREARYAWFAEVMRGDGTLLTAHHADDQLETILLRLAQGSGVTGMRGIPVRRAFLGGEIIRPFLGVSRDELVAYARAHNLRWVEDASNDDNRIARNQLRNEVIPLLKTAQPMVLAGAVRMAGNLVQAEHVLREVAAEDAAKLTSYSVGILDKSHRFNFSDTEKLSDERWGNLLRYWLKGEGLPLPDYMHMGRLLDWRNTPPQDGLAKVEYGGIEVRYFGEALYFMPRLETQPAMMPLKWRSNDADCFVETLGVRLVYKEARSMDWEVRPRKGGERIYLKTRGGHHSVKKLFQERRVPPWLRYRLPFIYESGELIAVPPYFYADGVGDIRFE